ncbi:chromosome partitioning protein ParA [Vibrio nomapromontoriensis]|uniref:nucleotide-binding protein n=1 Tax=Vibrio nomapromontoriensis TaxID=2910246 RepID=UPI003D0A55D2
MFEQKTDKLNNLSFPGLESLAPTCTFYGKTKECKNLIEEVFSFEGWSIPNIVSSAKELKQSNASTLSDLVIIEMEDGEGILAESADLSSSLSTKQSVIVIGKEDSINTMRGLKKLGFYYVLWPINKVEMIDFIKHVTSNHVSSAGVNQFRRAKRIAMIGSKGGVGNSLVCCELANVIANYGAETILVDHSYEESNLDIILNTSFNNRLDVDTLKQQLADLDEEGASGFLSQVKDNLNIFSVTGGDKAENTFGYVQSALDLLGKKANFIIEDYSSSINFFPDIDNVLYRNDIVVIVAEPSISSVRVAKKFIKEIQSRVESGLQEKRLIVFLNAHRPPDSFNLSISEVEDFLETPLGGVLEYNKNFSKLLIQGKRVSEVLPKRNNPFVTLADTIIGKKHTIKTSLIRRIMRTVS